MELSWPFFEFFDFVFFAFLLFLNRVLVVVFKSHSKRNEIISIMAINSNFYNLRIYLIVLVVV